MSGWNTIESDAGVFTELVEQFGVKGFEFEEVLSIDQETLRNINPLYGAIFLFKYRASSYAADMPQDGQYDADYDPQTLFFAHQRIQNACATQAVLSVILNAKSGAEQTPSTVDLGPELTEFKDFTQHFDAELRGDTISNSDVIRSVHNSFSRPTPFIDESEQAHRREDEENDGLFHFIAYVPVNGTLYELDGLQPFPISHGPCTLQNFPERLCEVLQTRISNTTKLSNDVLFNLLAVTHDKREYYRKTENLDALADEVAKRKEWAEDNILRKDNFVGLITRLAKGIAQKANDGEWEEILQRGRAKTRAKIEARRAAA